MITIAKARKALKAVVAAKGADYNYGDEFRVCRYANDEGEPRCIVGHVLAKLDPEALAVLHEREASSGLSPSIDFAGVLANRIAPEAMRYLAEAQLKQDERGDALGSRFTWGEALAAAEALYKRR